MTGQANTSGERHYLPAMGKHWLLPLYDPLIRLAGVGRVHEQLLDRAHLGRGQRVLEIGCGTGNLLRALARRHLDIDALGIDPDPAALRRARRKSSRARPPIRYERAYADELPLPDNSVDRVLSAFMLHHLAEDERTRALKEVSRVLRPGGELHVVDIDGTPPGRRAGHAHHDPRLANNRPERVLAALTDAGLTDVAESGRDRIWFADLVFYHGSARQVG